MKILSTLTLAALLLLAGTAKGAVPFEERLYTGQGVPFYGTSQDPQQQKMLDIARNGQLAESVARLVSQGFRLRYNVGIGFASCGQTNAFYDRSKRAVVICSELMLLIMQSVVQNREQFGQMSQDQIAGIATGVLFGIVLHELGHAVIDINQVPVVGREEDVADQFAVWFTLNFIDPQRQPVISPTIWFYRTLASQRSLASVSPDELRRMLANEHSLDEQRIYNLACWAIGANPQRGAGAARLAGLPEQRAARCSDEYARVDAGIRRAFGKYLRR
jgi:hypothetical protein